MTSRSDITSIADLFGNAVNQLGKLVHNEVQLARAEIAQKLSQAGTGAALITGAAILLIPTLVIFMVSAALFLVQLGFAAPVAYLLVASVGGLISIIVALIGLNRLTVEKLKPKVILQQLERDLDAVKEIAR